MKKELTMPEILIFRINQKLTRHNQLKYSCLADKTYNKNIGMTSIYFAQFSG